MSLIVPIRGATPADVWGYPDRRLTRFPVLRRLCWSGADGDASFTPTTATTYNFPRPIMFYRNLVIGSYAILKPPSGARVQVLCVSGTLQLDGVIDVSERGGAGGVGTRAGGAGGGGIIVIARMITGAGTIRASGGAGADSAGAPTAYSAGGAGLFKSISIPGGSGGNYGGGGGAGVWGSGGSAYGGVSGGLNPKYVGFLVLDADIYGDGYGAGGGAGGDYGAGGGGGGGLIIVMSENPVPSLTLQANGGSGGVYSGGYGGGGGGGGLIILVAPGDNSTKIVSGGLAGGWGGSNGEDGLALFIQAYPYEVIQ